MRKQLHRFTQLFLGFILATASCAQFTADSDNDPTSENAAWIALAVDNRSAKDNREGLDWLRHQSSFRTLNWDGVRKSRTDADLYSHVFEVPRYGAMRLLGTDGLSLSDFPSSAYRGMQLIEKEFL